MVSHETGNLGLYRHPGSIPGVGVKLRPVVKSPEPPGTCSQFTNQKFLSATEASRMLLLYFMT